MHILRIWMRCYLVSLDFNRDYKSNQCIVGSMTGALDFTNFKLNIFGCELEPTLAESDTYTFCSGGDKLPHHKNQVVSLLKRCYQIMKNRCTKDNSILRTTKSQSTLELDQNTQKFWQEKMLLLKKHFKILK